MVHKVLRFYDHVPDTRSLLEPGAANWSGLLPGTDYQTLSFIRAEPRSLAQGTQVLFCGTGFVRDEVLGGFTTYSFLRDGEPTTVSRAIDEKQFARVTLTIDGLEAAAQSLADSLYSVSPAQRVDAAWSLGRKGVVALIPSLWLIGLWDERTLLQDPGGNATSVRRAVRDALVVFGPALVEFIRVKKSEFTATEVRVARELASRCDSLLYWEEILLDANDPKPSARKRAVEELSPLSSPQAKALLARLAADPNADVRIAALSATKAL